MTPKKPVTRTALILMSLAAIALAVFALAGCGSADSGPAEPPVQLTYEEQKAKLLSDFEEFANAVCNYEKCNTIAAHVNSSLKRLKDGYFSVEYYANDPVGRPNSIPSPDESHALYRRGMATTHWTFHQTNSENCLVEPDGATFAEKKANNLSDIYNFVSAHCKYRECTSTTRHVNGLVADSNYMYNNINSYPSHFSQRPHSSIRGNVTATLRDLHN
jgi:hypothetical protein